MWVSWTLFFLGLLIQEKIGYMSKTHTHTHTNSNGNDTEPLKKASLSYKEKIL